jgi:hypothetical protein
MGPGATGTTQLGSRVGAGGSRPRHSYYAAAGSGLDADAGAVGEGGGGQGMMEAAVSGAASFQPAMPAGGSQAAAAPAVNGAGLVPATSVHAEVVVDENDQEADSGNASSRSGASQPSAGRRPPPGEIVSQPCGASHSAASQEPSASAPAAATATGPLSRSSGGRPHHGAGEQQGEHLEEEGGEVQPPLEAPPAPAAAGEAGLHASRDSSLGMATAGRHTRGATASTASGTVDMSIHCDSHRSGAGSQGGGGGEDEVQENSRDGEARGEPPEPFGGEEPVSRARSGVQVGGSNVGGSGCGGGRVSGQPPAGLSLAG